MVRGGQAVPDLLLAKPTIAAALFGPKPEALAQLSENMPAFTRDLTLMLLLTLACLVSAPALP